MYDRIGNPLDCNSESSGLWEESKEISFQASFDTRDFQKIKGGGKSSNNLCETKPMNIILLCKQGATPMGHILGFEITASYS